MRFANAATEADESAEGAERLGNAPRFSAVAVDRRVRALFQLGENMRIEDATKARVFTIFDAPKLDPITVTLQDVGPGAGRLIVECWGEAWAAYWGGMGNATLAEFVTDCGTDYITTKLTRDRMLKREVAYLERIVAAVQAALRSNA